MNENTNFFEVQRYTKNRSCARNKMCFITLLPKQQGKHRVAKIFKAENLVVRKIMCTFAVEFQKNSVSVREALHFQNQFQHIRIITNYCIYYVHERRISKNAYPRIDGDSQ